MNRIASGVLNVFGRRPVHKALAKVETVLRDMSSRCDGPATKSASALDLREMPQVDAPGEKTDQTSCNHSLSAFHPFAFYVSSSPAW